jgi:hypothetical protein
MMHSTEDSSGKPFPTIDLNVADVDLAGLHQQVLRRNGRVTLRNGSNGEATVLLTQRELDSLEEALEILSNSDVVRAVRDQIAMAAHLATPPPIDEFATRERTMHLR